MTTLSNPLAEIGRTDFAQAASPGGEVADYLALLKPRVMSLVVFTALVGMVVAGVVSGVRIHPVLAFASLLMIAVGAGASGALNMWWDADIDAVMTRTRKRPVPDGRITGGEALSFGLALSVGSVLVLGLASNWFAAAFLAFTIFFYAVVYTMGLKRWTAQNIVIGGAAGAFPPMVGAAAVTGSVDPATFVLFLVIFLWTPPHFWALALVKSGDYARAGVPMMPNVAGPDSTRRQILAYTVLLTPAGLAPVAMGFGGLAYAMVAAAVSLGMLALAWKVFRVRDGEAGAKAAQQLFGFSILHLFLLFATLLAEHGFGLFRAVPGLHG
jgi:protoheme IX farnesyltransferase